MANDFKITISAVDRATGSVRKINDSISKLTRPFDNVQRSMGALGKEIARNPIVKGLVNIESAAMGVATSVASIAAPMAALIGVGSIAGITSLVTGWARLGWEVGNTAATIGISTNSLQSWRGAAKLANVSSEEMTSGLKSFGTTLQDATYGRNGNALELMRILGLRLHKTADGAIDSSRALLDLSNVLAGPKFKGKSQEQNVIARTLGVEALLPLIRKGSDEIRKLQQESADLNPIKDNAAIAAAEAFTKNLNRMEDAVDGLKTSIGNSLMPVLQPLIEQFTKWVSENRELIGLKLGEWAGKVSKWFQETDFSKVAEDIGKVAKAFTWVVEKVDALVSALGGLNKLLNFLPMFKMGSLGLDLLSAIPNSSAAGEQSSSGKIKYPATGAPVASATPNTSGSSNSSRMPVGVRNNNPGNLRSWGDLPTRGGFAVFPDPAAGITAMVKQLRLYDRRGNNTIDGIVKTWAPSSENNTPAYIADIAKQTGRDPKERLNLNDPNTMAPLISAMIKHENGQDPYGKDMIDRTVQHAFTMRIEGLPAGASANVRNGTGERIPVLTSRPMPAFGG